MAGLYDDHSYDWLQNEDGYDWLQNEDDELVRRLRNLEWPRVRPELRQRCWEEFSRRIAEKQKEEDSSRAAYDFTRRTELARRPAFNVGERYEFSRRLLPARVAVAQSWSRRRSPARALQAA